MEKLYLKCLFLILLLKTSFAQENLETDVEIITGKEPTGKMLMPFHRPYSYPLIVQPQGPIYRASANLVSGDNTTKVNAGDNTEVPGGMMAKLVDGGNANSSPGGMIIFRQWSAADAVMVSIKATGLPQGKHAVHIHAYGDLREGCKSTGPHIRSILIGNIEVKESGKLDITFHSPYLSLFGPKGIIGRSIVIHEKPIEFNRFPDIYGIPINPTVNGAQFQPEEQNVGAIIACGVITITDDTIP